MKALTELGDTAKKALDLLIANSPGAIDEAKSVGMRFTELKTLADARLKQPASKAAKKQKTADA